MRALLSGFRNLFRGRKRDADLDAELRAFYEASVEAKLAAGMPRAEAERAARIELGSPAAVRDWVGDVGWWSRVGSMWQDVRHGGRLMRRQPGFTFVAILTLALGIGTNIAVFTLADGMLFRPLPYREPDRLTLIQSYSLDLRQAFNRVSRVDFEQIRAQHTGFEGLALVESGAALTWIGADGAEGISTAYATPNFLNLLGVVPHTGRLLAPGDELADPRPVMLRFETWRRLFGEDPAILGRPLDFQQARVQVVGVLPEGFIYPVQALRGRGELLFAREPDPKGAANPRAAVFTPLARLRPGVSLAEAQAEVDLLVRQAAQQFPSTAQDRQLRVADLQFALFEGTRPILWLLIAAAGCVLLIACVNLTGLLLARGISREREIGIRHALGASRLRVARQLASESLLLALSGGAVAVLVNGLTFGWLSALTPSFYRLVPSQVNTRGLAVALLLSLAASVLFGLLPALRLSRVDVNQSIRESRHARGTRGWIGGGRFLVAAEVALCLVLVSATVLTTASLVRLRSVDLGYAHAGALSFRVPGAGATPSEAFVFHEQVLDSVRRVPGILHAGAIDEAQLTGLLPLYGVADGAPEGAALWRVSPGYFAAVGQPVLEGRDLSDADVRSAAPVALVNQALARAMWPGRPALGQTIYSELQTPFTVIGVVGDVLGGPRDRVRPSAYVPLSAQDFAGSHIVAYGTGDPSSLALAIRDTVRRVDPSVVVPIPATLAATLGREFETPRFHTGFFLLFGVVALLVAAVGIYGVMAHWVSTRTRELGVRLALGADPRALRRLVVRQAAVPLVTGLLVGLFAALVLTRQLESLLYEIKPNDPATLAAAVTILLAVGLAAAYVPARRAALVDPVVALRAE